MSDRDLALVALRPMRIRERERECVQQDAGCLREADAVLGEFRTGLLRLSLEDHGPSIAPTEGHRRTCSTQTRPRALAVTVHQIVVSSRG